MRLYFYLLFAVILISGCVSTDQTDKEVKTGNTAGDLLEHFSLEDFDGNIVNTSDFLGKTIVINSWATWCSFCIDEMPAMQNVADNTEGIVVLFVHRTATESQETAKSFIEKIKNEKSIEIKNALKDPEDFVYRKFFGFGMPVTLIINNEGIIEKKKIGQYISEEDFEKDLGFVGTIGSGESGIGFTEEGGVITFSDGVSVDTNEIISGGVPKDGIPSIDNPKFIPANEAVWLPESEFGLGIVYKGEQRFYPFRILVSHEIANDFIQGDPILITYCPLCFTGLAFIREIEGEAVEFGVSGKLYNSELVMYDRKTGSYWPQSLGRAVTGELVGKEIQKLPTDTVEWGSWKKTYPNTKVLSKDTGFGRDYNGYNPYGNDGDFADIKLRIGVDNPDPRLPPQEIVYGIVVNGNFKAYPKDVVKEAGVIKDIVGSEEVTLTFDQSLGSIVVEKGDKKIIHETLFWFAWAVFHPKTEVYVSK